MADKKKKIMKDINLNDLVSVTLPAHVWVGFFGAYASTKWQSVDADAIGEELVDVLFDPVHVKESEAARQQHHDMHQGLMQAFITGRPPEVPPHMEDGGTP